MGEFEAGKWILGLSIYFFMFFLVVTAVTLGGAEMGIDTSSVSVNDPGFYNLQNQFQNIGTGTCSGLPYGFVHCSYIKSASVEVCSAIPGCSYNASMDKCQGTHNISSCYELDNNQTQCGVLGCTWTNRTFPSQVSQDSSLDWSVIRNSIGVMAGFNANLGMPGQYQFIMSFFLFWLPFTALLWAIYMALPFVH